MSKGQYKRLVFSIVFTILLLGVTIALLIAILDKPKDVVNRYYTGKDGANGQSIIGPIGLTGPQGLPGITGKDGQTVTNNITTNIPIPGPKGDTGNQGVAGNQLVIKVDPVTCKLLSKYDGDDYWNTLAQLPIPCVEASND